MSVGASYLVIYASAINEWPTDIVESVSNYFVYMHPNNLCVYTALLSKYTAIIVQTNN